MKKRYDEVYWNSDYTFVEDSATSSSRHFEDKEEIDVLFEKKISDDNIWNADIEFVVFRTKDNYLGYYLLTPSGYSSYTYDPDCQWFVYKTDDMAWFKRFALTEDLRKLVKHL